MNMLSKSLQVTVSDKNIGHFMAFNLLHDQWNSNSTEKAGTMRMTQ